VHCPVLSNSFEYIDDNDISCFPPFYLPSVLHYCLYSSVEAFQSAQPAFGMHLLSLMCEDTFLLCLYLMLEAHDKNMYDIPSERLFRAVIAGVSTFFEDVEKDVTIVLRLCLSHMIYTYNWLIIQPWCWVFRGELCIHFTPQDSLTAMQKMERVWTDGSDIVSYTTLIKRPEEPSDTTSWGTLSGTLSGTTDEVTSAFSSSLPERFASD